MPAPKKTKPGRGRPPKAPDQKFFRTTVTLPPDLKEPMEVEMAGSGLSFSEITAEALRRELKRRKQLT